MRFFIKLLFCLILAFALAAYMAIPANPEVKFWHGVDQQRNREIAETRRLHPEQPILFFAGGSSCAFSIDPKIIEEKFGMPAFNLGLPVSAGPKYLLHQALEKARKGDILVVALEPDALTYPSDFRPTTFTLGLATTNREPSATVGGSSFGETLTLRDCLNYSRPGPEYMAVWIGKKLVGKSYRYQDKDIRYHGRIESPLVNPALPLSGLKSVNQICQSGRHLLETFQDAASRKGVKLLYSMPWLLTADTAAHENRAANLNILDSIRPIIPTIDDGHQGVATNPRYFSDTGLHLSAEGSTLRTNALADAMKVWLSSQAIK